MKDSHVNKRTELIRLTVSNLSPATGFRTVEGQSAMAIRSPSREGRLALKRALPQSPSGGQAKGLSSCPVLDPTSVPLA
jgi:hypothetical protein